MCDLLFCIFCVNTWLVTYIAYCCLRCILPDGQEGDEMIIESDDGPNVNDMNREI